MENIETPKLSLKERQLKGEEALRTLYTHTLHGVVSLDSNGVIESCNPRAEIILGSPTEALLGKNIRELAYTPEALSFPPKSERAIDFIAKHSDGTKRFLELRFIPLSTSFLAIFHDATRRKKAEEELKNTNIILDTITKAEAQFLHRKDEKGLTEIFFELLQGALVVTGSQEGFLFSLNAIASSSPDWEQGVRSLQKGSGKRPPSFEVIAPFLSDLLEKKIPQIQTHLHPLDPYHRVFPKHLLAIPLIQNGALLGAIALGHPLQPYSEEHIALLLPLLQVATIMIRDSETEGEKNAAREEAIAEKNAMSSFLANMSHEIRTPLNIVMGMTELLCHTDLTQKQAEYAEKSYRAAEVLLELINNLLDLSKIEAGQLTLESIPFSLRERIGEVVELFQMKAKQKGIALTADLSPALPDPFTGDPTRIRQVVTNLLSNALKFTETGEVTLRVFPTPPTTRFEVIDTGPGLSPETAAHLFEKFIQGDSSITRKYGGTGLGLAICKQLVEAMGGEIGYTRNPVGSTFWFTL